MVSKTPSKSCPDDEMVTTETAGNIYNSIPNDLTDEIFETIVQNNNIKIERIISNGHTSPESGWYDQEENEWIMILKGDAIITFEDNIEIKLNEGSYLNIPAHTRHQVNWTSQQKETIWLAVHYSD